ncbi:MULTISPECIES: GTP-binding protein [unclassified Thiocapsa]|uniref:GTP-binding protein n=1 Tax=unclassified Thiocapsa TaxID=2641286 RepID=UPI0035AF7841
MTDVALMGQTMDLPFTVIGGYLGAGKTTLLNHLLTNTAGMRLAVLVNDFGSVNIDIDLIQSHDGETMSLANGCMCCSLVDGFAQAIGEIEKRAGAFDHLVIEASGVALPAKIAQYGQMYRLPLDGILVVVDAEQVRTQAENKYVGDTVLRQLAQADLLILNKTDLVPPEDLAGLRAWLAERSPGTPVLETVRAEVPLEVLLGARGDRGKGRGPAPDQQGHDHAHADQDHAGAYRTWTLERAAPLTRAELEGLAAGLGSDIYRAKGFVHLANDPDRRQVYQQVGARWSLEPGAAWGASPGRTQLVVIGRAGAAPPEALGRLFAPAIPVTSATRAC